MDTQLIKDAATLLEGLADSLEKVAADAAASQEKLAAAAELQKTAADQRAALSGLAKTAAASFYDAGLVQSENARDELAVALLDHDAALEQLAKIASNLDVPTVGHVSRVDSGAPAVPTSDSVWNSAVREVLAGQRY